MNVNTDLELELDEEAMTYFLMLAGRGSSNAKWTVDWLKDEYESK